MKEWERKVLWARERAKARRAKETLNPKTMGAFRSKGWTNIKDYGDHVSGFAVLDGIAYVLSAWVDMEENFKRIEMYTHAGGKVTPLGTPSRLVSPRDVQKMAKRRGLA